MIYPWQHSAWQQLAAHWDKHPNAWLLYGKAGTGKLAFAQYLAQALLCENPQAEHQPCGQCPSCHLCSQHSHPDLCELTPEIPEGDNVARKLLQIKVDAVRQVLDFVHLSAHRGGHRVVLVHPAESMNIQAANALLKVLEEPPPQVLFILVSHNKDALLPTIKSRCRPFALPLPSREQALAWLQQQDMADAENLLAFHGGAPLFADTPAEDDLRAQLLDLLAQPRLLALLDYAALFDRQQWPLSLLLDWLHTGLLDIARAQQQMAAVYYPGRQTALDTLGARTQPIALFALAERLNALTPYGQHTLNVKMKEEDLLIEYLHFWHQKH